MTDAPGKLKRSIRSWWFVDVTSPEGRFDGSVLAILVLFGLAILPLVFIVLTK